MSQRSTDQPTIADPIFKKSLGDVMGEAVRTQRQAPQYEGPPREIADGAEVLQTMVEELDAPDADDARFPMPVEDFRAGDYLHCGDVVLATRMGSFFSFLSRRIDHSDFAHSALVFATKRSEIGLDDSYVIETTMGGVELSSFGELVAPTEVYPDTGRPPEYIVGIKRLQRPWATPEIRAMVSGRMLRFLDIDDYDFSMLAALASRYSHFWMNLRSLLFGRAPSLGEYLRSGSRYSPAEFICSGFVQFAFVDMVREALERGHISDELADTAWRDVVFAPWVSEDTTLEDLLGVRPLELARTDRLAWKYLVYGGMVHRVDATEEVDALTARIRREARERAQRQA